MRYVQLIFSPTGGTGKAAEMIASEWAASAQTTDMADPAADFSKGVLHPPAA